MWLLGSTILLALCAGNTPDGAPFICSACDIDKFVKLLAADVSILAVLVV